MKSKLQYITQASAASVLLFTAVAANDPSTPLPESHEQSRQTSRNTGANRIVGSARSSDLLGMTVKNYQNEKLGTVKDAFVDLETGRIVQVILSSGGVLGVNSSLVAVPPTALHHDVASQVVHLDATKDKIKSSPRFDMEKWNQESDFNRIYNVYRNYGQESSYTFIEGHTLQDENKSQSEKNREDERSLNNDQRQRKGDREKEVFSQKNDPTHSATNIDNIAAGGVRTSNDQNANSTERAGGGHREDRNHISSDLVTADTQSGRNIQADSGERANGGHRPTNNVSSSWHELRITASKNALIPATRLSHLKKVSEILGSPVRNNQDEKLGKVENLLLDVSSGRVLAVVLSTGGFLGIGDEQSAVPPSAFTFTPDRQGLVLDASKEMLSGAPHFSAKHSPDFTQYEYSDGVYRAYNIEPYFSTNLTADADNTARNLGYRNQSAQTPLDQGNSQEDIATSAQIRKEIIADKSLSVNAHNVKIITKGGKVTLRGPVNSADEKRVIGDIANRVAFNGNVDNQLEVRVRTSGN